VTTITAWLQDLVTRWGPADALIEPGGRTLSSGGRTLSSGGRTLSFADLERSVALLAGGLAQQGLRRGDRLASFLPNGVVAIELFLAAARLGAVTIGVNTRYRADDLRHVVDRGRPRLLVTTDSFLGIDFQGIVSEALANVPSPPTVLWPADIERLRSGPLRLEDAAGPGDLLVAFTTSGTTGRPKLAAHDHQTTVRHLGAAGRSLDAGPGSTALLALPLCGTFGFVSAFAVLSGGGRVVVPPRFDAGQAALLMQGYGVTHLNGSDDMLLGVLDAGADLSAWRHGVVAEFTGRGPETVRRAEPVGARLTGCYGSSETFALLARWPADDPVEIRGRNGGIPVDPEMQVRVVDGELQLRGPSVLSAYLDEDTAAGPALVDGQWFATGDLGQIEPAGGFVYLARMGDALRLAGFLTDPAEIEQHLLSHPAVSGAQVVGTQSVGGGEIAVAFVTLRGEATETVLVEHCRARLANYKVPARVVVLPSFPTIDGANGVKIRKTELRQRAGELEL
jgi:fatty-acyl-CoA synthase